MKLIRCITTDNNAIFDNDFPDIKIMEDSQIALHSISFEAQKNFLVVDNGFNAVEYNLTDATPANAKVFRLANGQYDSTNYEDFLENFTDLLNQSLELSGKQIGTQFLVFIGASSKKATIGFKYNIFQSFADSFDLQNQVVITGGANSRVLVKNNDVNRNDDKHKAISSREFIKGSGVFRIRARLVADTGGNIDEQGFEMGLFSGDPHAMLLRDNITNKKISIKVARGHNYQIRENGGGLQDTGIAINQYLAGNLANNDTMQISIENLGGQQMLVARVYTALAENILFQTPYDGRSYFPYISIQGKSSSVKIQETGIKYNADPWATSINNVNFVGASENTDNNMVHNLAVNPPNQPNRNNTVFRLSLPQPVAQYLGFKSNLILKQGVEVQIVADTLFSTTLENDSYLLELLNINLESYDGIDKNGKRKNILSIIPENDNNGFVEYEPNTPYFINMNNREMNLNNIRMRVLRSDLEPPLTGGLTVATLLIKCKDE